MFVIHILSCKIYKYEHKNVFNIIIIDRDTQNFHFYLNLDKIIFNLWNVVNAF